MYSIYNNIKEYPCCNKCCIFKLVEMPDQKYIPRCKVEKAGAIIVDENKKSILLVRSKYKNVWGIPKGSIEDNEVPFVAAIREVKEETEIDLTLFDLTFKVNDRPEHIYYVKKPQSFVTPVDVNDAIGIVWLKLECLILMVARGELSLNNITRKLLRKLYGIDINTRKRYISNAFTENDVLERQTR
jgi:hypothetical protein